MVAGINLTIALIGSESAVRVFKTERTLLLHGTAYFHFHSGAKIVILNPLDVR
jgi:hypothetical protein